MHKEISPTAAASELLTDCKMSLDDVINIYGAEFTVTVLRTLSDMIEAGYIVPHTVH